MGGGAVDQRRLRARDGAAATPHDGRSGAGLGEEPSVERGDRVRVEAGRRDTDRVDEAAHEGVTVTWVVRRRPCELDDCSRDAAHAGQNDFGMPRSRCAIPASTRLVLMGAIIGPRA